jgi:hypothetical protein
MLSLRINETIFKISGHERPRQQICYACSFTNQTVNLIDGVSTMHNLSENGMSTLSQTASSINPRAQLVITSQWRNK